VGISLRFVELLTSAEEVQRGKRALIEAIQAEPPAGQARSLARLWQARALLCGTYGREPRHDADHCDADPRRYYRHARSRPKGPLVLYQDVHDDPRYTDPSGTVYTEADIERLEEAG
jgi:hypothetical protein